MNIGKLRALVVRQQSYLTIMNSLILLYLFFKDSGFEWYYLLIIPVWLILAALDAKYIWPQELEYWHMKSPVLKEIRKSIGK